MFEIRFHGRGGQGAVLASKMLAAAFYTDGYKTQAFASYGGERRGASVLSFLRVDHERIRARYLIYKPDCVIVMDPSLVASEDTFRGCEDGAVILVNSATTPSEIGYPNNFRIASVDANAVAIRHGLGSSTTPLINTAILGAFARISRETDYRISLKGVELAIKNYVPSDPEKNIEAAREAFEALRTWGSLLP